MPPQQITGKIEIATMRRTAGDNFMRFILISIRARSYPKLLLKQIKGR
jgi:hypothetical protein